MFGLEDKEKENLRSKLIGLFRKKAVQYGKFTLSSGLESNYFIDASKVTMNADGLWTIMALFWDLMGDIEEELKLYDATALGGPTMGADVIVGALLYFYGTEAHDDMKAFLVRKTPKNGSLIEGDLVPGDKAMLFEDVVTTGNQLFASIEAVKACGAEVMAVFSVVDRGEAKKRFAEAGIPYYPLFQVEEIVELDKMTDAIRSEVFSKE